MGIKKARFDRAIKKGKEERKVKDLSGRKLENFIKEKVLHENAWIVLSIATRKIRGGFTGLSLLFPVYIVSRI